MSYRLRRKRGCGGRGLGLGGVVVEEGADGVGDEFVGGFFVEEVGDVELGELGVEGGGERPDDVSVG